MKRFFILTVMAALSTLSYAQTDATGIDKIVQSISEKKVWSQAGVQGLTGFMQNYKKDCIKKAPKYLKEVCPDDVFFINDSTGRGNKTTKNEFFKYLEGKYKNCQSITVDSASVYKIAKGGEMYGLLLEQTYHSGIASEKNYFFMMLDINVPKQPRIRVFTSQSAPDPKFGLYGPGDFQ